MPDRTTLARLGKLVAADVTTGRAGANSWASSQALEAHPEAALDLRLSPGLALTSTSRADSVWLLSGVRDVTGELCAATLNNLDAWSLTLPSMFPRVAWSPSS